MDTAVSLAAGDGEGERYRVILAGICALILTVGLARFAYTPMLPIMCDEAGLSRLAGGWLATINYAGYMCGALLAASISDLARKFTLYRIGLVTAVLSTAAMGLTNDVMAWAALRFVAGLSSTAGLLLASGLVLNWLLRQGHRPQLGSHFMGLGLGIVVSGVAVAAMSVWLTWDRLWVGLAVLGVVFFVPAWSWLPAPGAIEDRSAGTETAANVPGRRWMWLLIAAYFCAGFGFVISATFIVAILQKAPQLAGRENWVWVIVGIAAAPSCFIWDRIAHSRGPIAALVLAYGVQTVSIVLPALTDGAAVNLAGAILFGATVVGIVSLTLTLVGRHFPENPAKAMARMTLGYGVAQIVAPAMAGYIAAATGSYKGALVVTAVVMVAGMGLLWALMAEERRYADHQGLRAARQ